MYMTQKKTELKTESMPRMTVKERIVVHLSRYDNVPLDSMNVPYELTQDGIGNIVGVSRAHVSLELRTLVKRGTVACWKAHIHGCTTRRYAYILTGTGSDEAKKLIDTFNRYGFDPTIVLDMRRCDPLGIWNAMSDEDRDILGIACLFRVPVARSILPRTAVAAIPVAPDGTISIPAGTAKSYLSYADPERIRFWHTWIAEYWAKQGEWQYAIYHFIMGRCFKEAEDCVVSHRNDVVGKANRDTLKSLKKVPTSEKRDELVYALAEVAMNFGDFETARKSIDALKSAGHYAGPELEADYLMRTGDSAAAAKAAEEAYVTAPSMNSAAIAAEAFAAIGEVDAATQYAKKAAELMTDSGDTFNLDRIFSARSLVAYRKKNYPLCLLMSRRAVESAPPCRLEQRKKQHEKMETLVSERR